MALLRRTVTHSDLNFYMPIVNVVEDMDWADKRDAVRTQDFCWRTQTKNRGSKPEVPESVTEECELTTIGQIVNGDQGPLRIVERFLQDQAVDNDIGQKLQLYLNLIRG